MMKCSQFTQNLDAYLSDTLNEQNRSDFLVHASDCPGCAQALESAETIITALRVMPVPPASAGFSERVLQQAKSGSLVNNAENEIVRHRSHGFVWGFGSALAAGVILWAVVALFPALQDASQPHNSVNLVADNTGFANEPVADVTITLDQSTQVNLVFDTVAALQNAKISIDLPSNIALPGYPELRHVEWRTNLVKGSNLLRLPVIATGLSSLETLTANIEYGEQKITTLKIKLAVVKQNLSQQALFDVTPV